MFTFIRRSVYIFTVRKYIRKYWGKYQFEIESKVLQTFLHFVPYENIIKSMEIDILFVQNK